ncbi:hypothetical protein BSU04_45850 [Caballeronia sordidicola]|uniref:Uncharacterized protein n=1 Tax=Caballeronia sordidicola TaxID=196367 RepID=A0A226WKD7_CABSO|nr:hypothetical protein BSU04_45850 [Caballeronia sordidicola]
MDRFPRGTRQRSPDRISPVYMQRWASIILAAFSLSLAWAALH